MEAPPGNPQDPKNPLLIWYQTPWDTPGLPRPQLQFFCRISKNKRHLNKPFIIFWDCTPSVSFCASSSSMRRKHRKFFPPEMWAEEWKQQTNEAPLLLSCHFKSNVTAMWHVAQLYPVFIVLSQPTAVFYLQCQISITVFMTLVDPGLLLIKCTMCLSATRLYRCRAPFKKLHKRGKAKRSWSKSS